MEQEAVALAIDAKGLACPMPIFKAKQGLKSVQVGEVVEVLCTDPGSMADFKAFANSTGHELLAAEQQDKIYRFLLRRTK
jgi:tRNA 2-thiouridine synthesizing protein A